MLRTQCEYRKNINLIACLALAITTVSAAFLSTLAPSTPAAAQSRSAAWAEHQSIGFSPDGRYFAFQEYGYDDARARVFANIYLIDTHNNTWVSGSPFRTVRRVRNAPGTRAMRHLRTRNLRAAEKLLGRAEISEIGETIALADTVRPPRRMVVDPNFLPDLPTLAFSTGDVAAHAGHCTRSAGARVADINNAVVQDKGDTHLAEGNAALPDHVIKIAALGGLKGLNKGG